MGRSAHAANLTGQTALAISRGRVTGELNGRVGEGEAVGYGGGLGAAADA
ncbi:MAG: hypothetical protein QOH18_828 [Solirubrobacterales bacterium]|jgi:hypothetical protein|nr:hypothetical protein [Solirubrobacterales bacterium]